MLMRIALSVVGGIVATGVVYATSDDTYSASSAIGLAVSVAALVMAVFIYVLQQQTAGEAHAQVLDELAAHKELLADLAEERQDEVPEAEDPLTPAQRTAVERAYGQGSIEAAWKLGAGKGNRPRLVRLADGRLISVYSGGRVGGTYVREVGPTEL